MTRRHRKRRFLGNEHERGHPHLNFYCPGGVFGFWYLWGAMCTTIPRNMDSKLYAVSASSLAAVCYLCDLNVAEQINITEGMRNRVFTSSLMGVVREWLEMAIPHDRWRVCNGRLVVVVRTLPFLKKVYVSNWKTRSDLIDTLIAACSWFWPVRIGKMWCVDACTACIPEVSNILNLPSIKVWYPPDRKKAEMLYAKGRRDGSDERVKLGWHVQRWSRGAR